MNLFSKIFIFKSSAGTRFCYTVLYTLKTGYKPFNVSGIVSVNMDSK